MCSGKSKVSTTIDVSCSSSEEISVTSVIEPKAKKSNSSIYTVKG